VVLSVFGAIAAIVWSNGIPQLLSAIFLGFAVTVLFVGWMVGGNAHSLCWMWGAVGEQQTAAVLEKLGDEWLAVHDVPRRRGNWDHILVGPSGIFVLDSKHLSRPASVSADALRCGRLKFEGRTFRGAAIGLKEALEGLGLRPPYVHAVAVVWGDFAQRRWEEENVAYVHGADLVDWLRERPRELQAERLGTVRDAVCALAAAESGADHEIAALEPSA
jgi:hypothetical protein